MKYTNTFKQLNDGNNTGVEYTIEIITNDDVSQVQEIELARHPVTISTNSDGIFAPIKSRSAKIRLLTKQPIFDVYTSTAQGTKVYIKQGNNIIFFGYLTPNVYNQPFDYMNIVELEAVDAVSTLKYIRYTLNGGNGMVSIGDLLDDIVEYSNYASYQLLGNFTSTTNVGNTDFNDLLINENNFFEDQGEKDAWTYYKMLEEICKYFGLSAVPNGNVLYLIDYNKLQSIEQVNGDYVYPNEISLDETYNKIIVSANTFVVDDSDNIPDLTDEGNMSILGYNALDVSYYNSPISDDTYNYYCKNMGKEYCVNYNWGPCQITSQSTLVKTTAFDNGDDESPNYGVTREWKNYYFAYPYEDVRRHFLVKDIIGSGYITSAAINKTDTTDHTDWTTYMYLSTLPDNSFNESEYIVTYDKVTNEYYQFEYYNNFIKTTIASNEKLLFQYISPSYPNFVPSYYTEGNVSGTTAYNNTAYIIISGKVKISDTPYERNKAESRELNNARNSYNGVNFLMASLQISNKWWNGSQWTTQEAKFPISMGNSETQFETEKWIDITNTNNGLIIVDNDGFMIPITLQDNLSGKITFKLYSLPIDDDVEIPYYINKFDKQTGQCVYTSLYSGEETNEPSYIKFGVLKNNQELLDFRFGKYDSIDGNDGSVEEKDCIISNQFYKWNYYQKLGLPYILIKDFKLNIETISGNFLNVNYKKDNGDTEYSNVIDDDYVNQFSDVELRINTQDTQKPVSYSSIMNSDTTYVEKINGRKQEYNLVEKYANHHSTPKKILSISLDRYIEPTKIIQYSWNDGKGDTGQITGIIDTQEWDVEYKQNTIKIIEL